MEDRPPAAGSTAPAAPQQQIPGSPSATSTGVRRPLYRRLSVLVPMLVLLAVAAAGFRYWYVNVRGVISTDDAFLDGDRVSVSAKMLGRIVELRADEGDTVHQGDLLIRLDDTDLQAERAQAEANLAYSEESAKLAAVEVQQAHDDFDRARTQFQSKVIPQEQFDHARTAVDAAEARQRIAQAQIRTARARLPVLDAQLANTHVEAPLTGVVARRWVLAGDVVQPGQPMLAIYSLGDLWITAHFEETKLRRLHPGDSVAVAVDAYPGQSFAGRILWIGAAASSQFSLIPPNNASGNFTKVTQRVPVRISLERPAANPEDPITLVPGMSVEVRIRAQGP
jgi:membrane fusion protein, multidrug efflux system